MIIWKKQFVFFSQKSNSRIATSSDGLVMIDLGCNYVAQNSLAIQISDLSDLWSLRSVISQISADLSDLSDIAENRVTDDSIQNLIKSNIDMLITILWLCSFGHLPNVFTIVLKCVLSHLKHSNWNTNSMTRQFAKIFYGINHWSLSIFRHF